MNSFRIAPQAGVFLFALFHPLQKVHKMTQKRRGSTSSYACILSEISGQIFMKFGVGVYAKIFEGVHYNYPPPHVNVKSYLAVY